MDIRIIEGGFVACGPQARMRGEGKVASLLDQTDVQDAH